MAGHDLRQPLQVIISSYELLSQRVDKDLARECLDRGQSAITQLIEQLESPRQRPAPAWTRVRHRGAPVALGPIFAALERDQRDFANLKDVRLDIVPTQAALISDELLLEGILRNLTRNALKYTQRRGRVLIGCRQRGTELRIEVHDTGVGMPPDKLASVFHAFYRLDATQPNGLGLGLFVVKRAADLLGHRVEVCSTLGRGSRFTVVAKAAARPSAQVA